MGEAGGGCNAAAAQNAGVDGVRVTLVTEGRARCLAATAGAGLFSEQRLVLGDGDLCTAPVDRRLAGDTEAGCCLPAASDTRGLPYDARLGADFGELQRNHQNYSMLALVLSISTILSTVGQRVDNPPVQSCVTNRTTV